jgi:hypothetical protein
MAISSRNQLWSELNGNVSLLYKLEGNAPCGPACGVLWGLGERNPRLPDWASFLFKPQCAKHPLYLGQFS